MEEKMKSKRIWFVVSFVLLLTLLVSACQPAATPTQAPQPTQPPAQQPTQPPAEPQPTQPPAEPEEFILGMLLVGPYNDRGWSQAHYDAGLYVEKKMPGVKLTYIDKVNPADRPGTTPEQLAEDLLSKGAKLIIFNSDDMKDGAINFARAHPDVPIIHASGDTSWKEGVNYIEFPKFGNTMGKMEYGKMIAGCAAALTTKTGQIGYLGPLINDETRRLTASAYLGAKYCYEKYAGKDPAALKFKVTWIGFWFNIPGFTADPTQVADDFLNSGYDVVISGIDTTEALVQASKARAAGKEVWAVPYDYEGACAEAPEVCLGVPYFNWGPAYLRAVEQVKAGTFKSYFEWLGPDWTNINNHDTSAVGFVFGDALSADAKANVEKFIAELAGGLNLFVGPLNYQDGTPFLAEGEVATDLQIWYLPQLLEGMEGQSVPSN
jgi:simple sugar transport system substrate-binding protein